MGDGLRVGSGTAAPVHALPPDRSRRRALRDPDPHHERAALASSGGDRQLILVWRPRQRSRRPPMSSPLQAVATASPARARPEFAWDDPFRLDEQLTED